MFFLPGLGFFFICMHFTTFGLLVIVLVFAIVFVYACIYQLITNQINNWA